jgi:hypothetical protein
MWLIDHGATLSFHHRWPVAESYDVRTYDAADHVLLACRPDVRAADESLGMAVTEESVRAAVDDVPEEWLVDEPGFEGVDDVRTAYVTRVLGRLDARAAWLPALVESAGGAR